MVPLENVHDRAAPVPEARMTFEDGNGVRLDAGP